MNFKFLTSKELKPIFAFMKDQWGFDEKLELAFFITNKDRIHVINRAIGQIDFSKLRINSMGLYFGEMRNDELRLSIEGSQLVGPNASKNIIELNSEERKQWLQGQDIDKVCDANGFAIIKAGADFIGCGKYKD